MQSTELPRFSCPDWWEKIQNGQTPMASVPLNEVKAAKALAFFNRLRQEFEGGIACEPRHPTWFTPEVYALLTRFQVARVAADPAPVPAAAEPGGWRGLIYYRLHGSPKIYYSRYSKEYLDTLASTLPPGAWCIFDNTAEGEAIANALGVLERLEQRTRAAVPG